MFKNLICLQEFWEDGTLNHRMFCEEFKETLQDEDDFLEDDLHHPAQEVDIDIPEVNTDYPLPMEDMNRSTFI